MSRASLANDTSVYNTRESAWRALAAGSGRVAGQPSGPGRERHRAPALQLGWGLTLRACSSSSAAALCVSRSCSRATAASRRSLRLYQRSGIYTLLATSGSLRCSPLGTSVCLEPGCAAVSLKYTAGAGPASSGNIYRVAPELGTGRLRCCAGGRRCSPARRHCVQR